MKNFFLCCLALSFFSCASPKIFMRRGECVALLEGEKRGGEIYLAMTEAGFVETPPHVVINLEKEKITLQLSGVTWINMTEIKEGGEIEMIKKIDHFFSVKE